MDQIQKCTIQFMILALACFLIAVISSWLPESSWWNRFVALGLALWCLSTIIGHFFKLTH